jgi:serine phosphatase RsbU (regulator of sigma subunit)
MKNTIKARILVIDDDAAILRSISAYLEDSGYTVKTSENGKEGLEMFEHDKLDLVLTDLHMPVLGGLEVLHTITKKNPDFPVVVISGAGELNDAIEALRLGAWDFITKPISDLQVLEHAIDKAMERKLLLEENKTYADHIEHNLKILEEDHIAGRRVQMSLLPVDHMLVHDFEFKFKIIPSLELSGDFVEYFNITDNLVGVYIADVSGHGASSAFITVLLRSIISKYQVHYNAKKDDTIINPQKLMRALSNEIYAAKLNKYITLIYGVVNTTTNEFCYGVGGHYPNPILCDANGKARTLEGSGFPIGIMVDVNYEVQTVLLQPGEHLVLFSDGVMEVFMSGHNLTQKEQGLLNAVQTSKGDISALLRATGVTTKTNIAQPDDISILVVTHI